MFFYRLHMKATLIVMVPQTVNLVKVDVQASKSMMAPR